MRFLFLRLEICLHLPLDSTSRQTPLAFDYLLPTIGRIRDFNPLETCAVRCTKKERRILQEILLMSTLFFQFADLWQDRFYLIVENPFRNAFMFLALWQEKVIQPLPFFSLIFLLLLSTNKTISHDKKKYRGDNSF